MAVRVLLDRLDRVKECAPDRWRAICPAHESKHRTQSLAIRELPDGTLLIRCHAGCDVGQIVTALGLELRDLFPRDHKALMEPRGRQRPHHWHTLREAVQTLHHECLLVALAAEDVAAGRAVSFADATRVSRAAGRIRAAIEACT
jgi:hypothetical protein